MKNLVQLLCMIFLLALASCSSVVERNPAEVENELLNQIFSFTQNEKPGVTDYTDVVQKDLKLGTANGQGLKTIEFIKVKTLPDGALFKVELDRDPKNAAQVFRIYSTPKAYKSSTATYLMANFVYGLMKGDKLGNQTAAAFEMYHNAIAGDPIAIDNFLKLRINPGYMTPADTDYLGTKDYLDHLADFNNKREQISDEIKQFKKAREVASVKRKASLDVLDKLPEAKQFRSLVAKNDRKGAASLLKKYLPWEDMGVFEKQFWETYLEVMVNPVPLDQRVLIYRGLNDDYIHRGIVAGKELSEKDAILKGNAFVMSSGMVKNQGSWNRRLRSLEAMNKKFIATIDGNDEYAQSARITTMFSNHAGNPQGSPFISLSPSLSIAESFGSKRISSYLIDPRLLSFNYASSFANEVEYLIPLTTFPDELVAIADTELIPDAQNYGVRPKYLEEKLDELLSKKFGADKDDVLIRIKKNSYQFFKLNFSPGDDIKGPAAGPGNIKFYKKLPQDTFKPAMTPTGELTCKDLIETFWMAK